MKVDPNYIRIMTSYPFRSDCLRGISMSKRVVKTCARFCQGLS